MDEVSHRRVLAIAVPILLSNLTVPLLGLVDTAVMGRLGEAAPLAAVALGAMLLMTAFWLFGFLRMGVTGLAAQAIGRADLDESAALLARGVVFGAGAGVVLIALKTPLIGLSLWAAPASGAVEILTGEYMGIRVWAAPATIGLYAINGWLIAAEKTRALLVVQLVTTLTNAGLDVVFVAGLDAGVAGVAWASVIAEWLGVGLGLWLCRAPLIRAAGLARSILFDAQVWRALAVVNGDILIRSLLLQLMFLGFTFLGATIGETTLAANQVLMQFLMISAFALDALAHAMESLVGQALGARDRAKLRRAAVVGGLWSLGASLAITLGFAIFGRGLIEFLTTAPDVRAVAYAALPFAVIIPVFGAPAFLLDGIFIGATQTRDMRNMMAISAVLSGLCAWALIGPFGNTGLWIALTVWFVLRGITLALVYPRLERRAV